MLNIEKYKNDLIDNNLGHFAFTKDNKICSCIDISCKECCFSKNGKCGSNKKRIEWLASVYKEPILTDKEKELIKTIIETFNENWLISIEWIESLITSKICICARKKEDRTIVETIEIPTLFFKESMFEGLEKNREYTIEELGL